MGISVTVFGVMMSLVCLAVGLDLLFSLLIFSPSDCQLQTMSGQISSSSSGIGNNVQNGLEPYKSQA